MIERPKVFRWVDFFTTGGAAMVATGLAVWATVSPHAEGQIIGKVITWGAAIGFWFVYAMLLRWRHEAFSNIDYVTRHGLYVLKSRVFEVRRREVEEVTEAVLQKWEQESGWPHCRDAAQRLFVQWRAYPFKYRQKPDMKWTGFFSESSHAIVVGYRKPLGRTAFGHELGHAIYRKWQGWHTDREYQAFTKPRGLP